MTETEPAGAPPAGPSTTAANGLYLLHALAPFTLWSLAVVAVIIGAIARDGVRGTWVETHYSWLARTFGWGLLFLVAVTIVFYVTIIGIFLVWIPWGLLTIWYLYRVVRGWLLLADRKPAPY